MELSALLLLFIFAIVTICSAGDSRLLQAINRIKRSGKEDKNSGGSGDQNQTPVNFGFPTFGSWPQYGFPQQEHNKGGQASTGWPQFGGGSFGGGNIHGRSAFDSFPNVEGAKGQQVSSGVSCTYNKEGKEKCTHHRYHKNKNW